MNLVKAYEVLKIDKNSSIEEIKKAYRKLSLQYHPDRNKNSQFNDQFLQIKQAYIYLIKFDNPNASQSDPIKPSPANELKLELTLKELFFGCTKHEKITRKVIDEKGNETFEEKTFDVQVQAGLLDGTRITFKKEGDCFHGKIPANVVFIVQQQAHPFFQRLRFDLKYTATITSEESIFGCKLSIPTLDDDTVSLTVKGIVTKRTVERIANRGFPYPSTPGKRGDLLVAFEISDHRKTIEKDIFLSLSQILNGCSKNIKINRKTLNPSGSERVEDKVFTVNVKPGTEDGTRIDFFGEGDQSSCGIRGDVVFVVRVESHDLFERDGPNLIYIAQITQNESRKGYTLSIPTIDLDPIELIINGPVNKDGYRVVNRGLPYSDNSQKRGDLVINFELREQAKLTEKDLSILLEEIAIGCTKQLDFRRRIIDEFGNETFENDSLAVQIKPGIKDGEQIILSRKGDKQHGKIPADLIVIIREIPHRTFKRIGADIEYSINIKQNQLINKEIVEIPTLTKETKRFQLYETIDENSVSRIENCGLPHFNQPEKLGDILVRFHIVKFKDPDIIQDLPLTLENILNGCAKRIKINHRILDKNGNENFKDEIVVIDVKPGTIEGTEFRFLNLGDENRDSVPADIVFKVRDKPHINFIRNGADIVHKVMITKSEIEQEIEFEIPTLEGKTKLLKLLNFTKTGDVKKYFGKGFPTGNNSENRGNFIVQFEIVKEERKGPNVEHKLPISLEHVLYGNSQKMKINRTVIDLNGNEKSEEKIVTVNIKPGTETGKIFTFAREGDIRPGYIPGDVVFEITDKPHDIFKRIGPHLELKVPISVLSDQTEFQEFKISTLENTIKTLKMDKITKDSFGKVEGCGLPYSFEPMIRGYILVRFKIIQNMSDRFQKLQYKENPIVNKSQIKDHPVYINVELTLKEILNGGVKNVKFKRETIYEDGRKSFEIKKFNLELKPGILAGEKIMFENQGHRNYGKISGDVVFVTKDVPHEYFTRNGADIEYTSRITNFESNKGFQRKIPTLNNEDYLLIVEKLGPNNTEIIEGYGLPYYDKPEKRGNIVVKFEVFEKDNDEEFENDSNMIQMPPIELNLEVSLENILHGHTENFQLPISVIDSNGVRKHVTKILNIVIKPGTETGEKIVFPKHGNQYQGTIPADVVFVVQDKPHDKFKRNGVDIEYTAKISAVQAAKGNCRMSIPTLENAIIPLDINQQIQSETIIRVEGHGLPYPDDPARRGGLNVRFKIIPKNLNRNHK